MKLLIRQIFLLVILSSTLSASPGKPNLLIVHTDEHSFRTLSCYQELMPEDQAFVWGKGNNVETPNIDRLAIEGAICTSYYASSPVCTPSRASLITGLYPQATGAPKNGDFLREDIPTIGHILAKEGYSTSYVGKWHLAGNGKYSFDIDYNGGFEDSRYMMDGGHAPYLHFSKNGVRGISQNVAQKLPKSEIIHMTDFFTDKTLEILQRDKDKPFFVMLSIPDPHTPDYARPPYHKMYDHMDVQPPRTMSPEYTAVKPTWAGGVPEPDKNEAKAFDPTALRQYFGMVKHIDDSVGRLLEFLEKNKLTENTIVVFTADHGDMFFEHNRRNKGVPYEASAKIPFVIRYPKRIMPRKVIHTAFTNVDFVPTILSIMNIDCDVQFHGLDAASQFLSKEKEISSDRITYYAKTGGWWVAAVNDRYKLVLSKDERPWLFDLEKDPDELINFYDNEAYNKISKRMQKVLFDQMREFNEPGLKSDSKPYLVE